LDAARRNDLGRTDQYHLDELKIATDPSHPAHLNPEIRPGEQVLDVGCGAGQTLIAACPGRVSFGIDIDMEAMRFGRTLTQEVAFSAASAENLPFRDESFDVVFARVSLPYTRLDLSLREIHRVLRPKGRFWTTLHPFSLALAQARSGNWKGWIFFSYVVTNGLLHHFTGRQFPFRGRMESIQTAGGMTRQLSTIGFDDIRVTRGRHFLVEARKSARKST
jgi:ubiquinone/menaquinone biosynthesis C-methylase UbiE